MIELRAKPVKALLAGKIEKEVTHFSKEAGRPPKLVVALVGTDPASVIYTSKKGEAAERLGFAHETIQFPQSATPKEVKDKLSSLNSDDSVDGILIQRPLPKQFNESEVLLWVSPDKDVDGFHPQNVGQLQLGLPTLPSCTPAGVMEILKYYKVETEGKLACVIGRSSIVGKPMHALLLQANATVIQCHSKTKKLAELTRQADILIVAAGQPRMVDQTFIKKGATVIDVGIHRTKDGKVVGDVDFEKVAEIAGALTPVPGGVGPMTITMLLKNTITAAKKRKKI